MDAKIFKSIVCNDTEMIKEIEDSEVWTRLSNESEFPLIDNHVLNIFCQSVSNLLSYKVSEAATQRYLRMLQEWSHVTVPLPSLHIFTDGCKMLKFVEKVSKKYLTDDFLGTDAPGETLICLARAFFCLGMRNPCFLPQLDFILERITHLEPSEEINLLLDSIMKNKEQLLLKPATMDRIYILKRVTLIEKPLIENFESICSKINTVNRENMCVTLQNATSIREVLDRMIDSPQVFRIASNVLKEMLVTLNYSSIVIDFIQSILELMIVQCDKCKKSVLDLYPRDLQSCIILLRIDPRYHSENSKKYTLELLEHVHTGNKDDALILLSHFPAWLEIFSTYLSDITGR
ncbi:uncharacterized protein LOC107267274 isoform X2 [Cephus cinctus]|uniref:Uncharacterized protein LOC107267274 isoform X2 n=1 Tax=Cephus cinctus TaxID=211228 RepID=A0AAJ7BUJ1_CEPCN|nr:uncharacterized protein LOC107267274 isoform X2 [Cephus cinctus]